MSSSITAAQVGELTRLLVTGARPGDPADQIELITALEELKSAACAVQAETSVEYDAARRSAESAQGVPARRQGRGVAAELALARKESPHRGQALLGFAKVLRAEMPHTLARLMDGTLSEWRAMLLVKETACLTAEHRVFADEELCADPEGLVGLGTRKLVAKAKRLAYELDPQSVVRRSSNAENDRNVTCRPAPDTMTYLTALLPVSLGVAAHAALLRDAAALQAQGDPRSKGQLMADLLVARLTGVPMRTGETPPAVPVGIARLIVAHALTEGLDAWIRQLYTDRTGRLVAMTSKQRFFPQGLSDFLAIRDQGICRSPYCDASVRHTDHVQPFEAGGKTSAGNGQGLCEACNHAKQAPEWRQQATDEGIESITPTGHRYLSHTPPPVGWRQPRYVKVAPGRYQLVA